MHPDSWGTEEKAITYNENRWISEFMDSLDNATSVLEKQHEILYKKLDGVLTPEHSEASPHLTQTEPSRPQMSHLANRLESIISRLDTLRMQGDHLLNRIEL
jgi:hypothetical protein